MPGGRNTLGTCNVSVSILGTKRRVFLSKNSVFHWVPPLGETLGGVISSPFGWRSVTASILAVWGCPSCLDVLWSCWAALKWEGLMAEVCSSVGYNTEWMFFLALRMILSTGCSKSQIKQAQAELGPCSSLRILGTFPRVDPVPWEMLLPQLHTRCFTWPSWLLYVPPAHPVCATTGASNLVIDSRFKTGMGNEEMLIYHWIFGR